MSHATGEPPLGYITLIRAANLKDMSYAQAASIARKMEKGVFVDPWKISYVKPSAFNAAADSHIARYGIKQL